MFTNYLHINCAEYGLNNDLIHLKQYVLSAWHTAILLQSLLTWFSACNEIRVLAFYIHMICSETGFKHNLRLITYFVCLRLAYYLYWIWTGNM